MSFVANSDPPRGPRLLFWTSLAVGASTFVALAIVLLVCCFRGEVVPLASALAEALPVHREVSEPAAATIESLPVQVKPVQVKKEAATPEPAKSLLPPPALSGPVKIAVAPPVEKPASLTVAAAARGSAKPAGPDGNVSAPAKTPFPKLAGTGPISIFPAAKTAFFDYPVDDPPVNRAIARGVAYLKRSDDFRIGGKALAGLTLLSCGVPAKDAAVTRFATEVRAGLPLTATYELALCLLFLDRLGDSTDEATIRRIALQLIAGQGMQGGWNYQCFRLSAGQEKKLLSLLQAPIRRATGRQTYAARVAVGPTPPPDLRDLPGVQYRPGQQLRFQPSQWHEDNSLTQFVILALWRAREHCIPVERSLAMVEARFRASQNPDGSWGYKWGQGFLSGSFRADSMTCAGLLGLAVGRGVEPLDLAARSLPAPALKAKPAKPAQRQDGDPAIENALLFLSQKIGAAPVQPDMAAEQMKANAMLLNLQMQLAQSPPAQRPLIMHKLKMLVKIDNRLKARGTILGANARGDLYYLWSLERAAVAYDLRTIGGKDWYAWGAPLIIAHQHADGSWADLYPGVPDTCFALLFLKRVNVARDLTLSLQRLTLSREAAGRMHDMSVPGGSSGERMQMARPKGPPVSK